MIGKLCILLLGLSVFAVSLSHARPGKREVNVRLGKREVNIFEQKELPSREEVVEYLKSLDQETIEDLSDDQKLALIFLIFKYGIDESELYKHPELESIVERALKKRETTLITLEEKLVPPTMIEAIKVSDEDGSGYSDAEDTPDQSDD